MTLSGMLMNGLWAGLFSAAIAVLFTAPARHLVATFACGLVARLVRDLLVAWGASLSWSTVVAAAAVVLVAVAFVGRHRASPVVLIAGVFPLGSAFAMFNTITALLRLSTATGEALNAESIAFTSNLAKSFVLSLAVALGLAAGLAAVGLLRQQGGTET